MLSPLANMQGQLFQIVMDIHILKQTNKHTNEQTKQKQNKKQTNKQKTKRSNTQTKINSCLNY